MCFLFIVCLAFWCRLGTISRGQHAHGAGALWPGLRNEETAGRSGDVVRGLEPPDCSLTGGCFGGPLFFFWGGTVGTVCSFLKVFFFWCFLWFDVVDALRPVKGGLACFFGGVFCVFLCLPGFDDVQ